MERHEFSSGPIVAVIGAGFGGILTAIHLKEKLNFNNFLIFEKDSDVGGTWRDNIYPGCRCDNISHFYTLSTDLKSDWTETCPTQPDILSYIKDVIRKHRLEPYIVLNTKVVLAEWLSEAQAYKVTTEDTKGSRSTLTANVIVSATGLLHVPRMPTIPGIESFRGKLFHSAKWDTSVDLTGKRVAVIGNGSTGTQIVAEIPKIDGIQVTQFYKSRNWILPGLAGKIPRAVQWVLYYVPLATLLFRWLIFWLIHEFSYFMIFKFKSMRNPMKKFAAGFMKAEAPEKYHDILVPDFPVGCRRIVFDPGYLQALRRPNVDVRCNNIAQICPEGIITTNGEKLPFDVIVCATGFVVGKYPIPIYGRNNETIQEYYDKTEGPNAYLGINVPGFPNFYMLSGPNTTSGYTSFLFFEESQMQYISKLIGPVLNGTVSSFEVTREANEAYNKVIQEKIADGVFAFHKSWYHVNLSGRNCATYPLSCITYWWTCQSVNWDNYKISGLKGDIGELNRRSMVSNCAIAVGLGVVGWLAAIAFSG